MTAGADRPGDRGFALVAVLAATLLLAVIAQSFVTQARTDATIARNVKDNAQARALADGALYRAVAMLLRDRSQWNFEPDGRAFAIPAAGAAITVAIQDEGGKIDLNRARAELLEALFLSVGVDADKTAALTDAVADWRDRDDQKRLHGAEDDDYRDADRSHGAKDGAFDMVQELALVLGVSPALFAAVEPTLTVHSGKAGVNARVAPRPVLLALAQGTGALAQGTEEKISTFLENRDQSDPDAGQAGLDFSPRLLSNSNGTSFTIRAAARLHNGAVFVRDAAVRISPAATPPYTILSWRRGRLPSADQNR